MIARIETRLAAWLQGWTLIVLAAFVWKALSAAVPWWGVAVAGGVETLLVMLVLAAGHWKYRTILAMNDAERKRLGE